MIAGTTADFPSIRAAQSPTVTLYKTLRRLTDSLPLILEIGVLISVRRSGLYPNPKNI